MGETYSTHGSEDKFIQDFSCKNLKGRDHSEDVDVDGKIIRVDFREIM
jgi:hypothetical protein